MWLEDSRFPRGRGHYETRRLYSGAVDSTVREVAAGNGARVGLVFAAEPDTDTTSANYVLIGTAQGNVVAPLRTLTTGIAHCALSIDRDGDIVLGPIAAQAAGTWQTLTVHEVVWHPEG